MQTGCEEYKVFPWNTNDTEMILLVLYASSYKFHALLIHLHFIRRHKMPLTFLAHTSVNWNPPNQTFHFLTQRWTHFPHTECSFFRVENRTRWKTIFHPHLFGWSLNTSIRIHWKEHCVFLIRSILSATILNKKPKCDE